MMMTSRPCLLAAVIIGAASTVAAQPLGTFRWQLQPYCNVISVTVTQVGATYRLEGTDDRCGAAEVSSVIGTAFPNPDGSVGLGFNIVAAPDGVAQPVAARLSLATLSGTWSDARYAGTFAFTPGAGAGGSPRPVPASGTALLSAFRLQPDGGFLASGALQTGILPASGAGVRLMWAPAKAAIRAGRVSNDQWNDASIGSESAAFNRNTVASGAYSLAANDATTASGVASVALGSGSTASGLRSFASGILAAARGQASFASGAARADGAASLAAGGSKTWAAAANALAIGEFARAEATASVVLGNGEARGVDAFAAGSSSASGARSVALGSGWAARDEAVALGPAIVIAVGMVGIGSATASTDRSGTFYFGDRSTTSPPGIGIELNQFVVRAAGGVGFYTNAATTSGVELASGGGSWAPLSDATMKAHFTDVPGDEVLRKLSRVPIREWNYIAQDASIRHLGPTAQDFRAAFGLGDFPLRINTIDADGVALAAARALDTITRDLAERHTRLSAENGELRAVHAGLVREQHELIDRLGRLERLLEGGRR